MIYLFTGNMGAGKTPRVVSMILNNEDGLFKMELEDGTEADRPLYFLPYRRIGQTKIQCPRTGGRANHVRPAS